MEPIHLTPPDPVDVQLDALFRTAAEPPPADDGFSTRVLAALPPPTPELFGWGRREWTLVGLTVGLLIVLVPQLRRGDLDGIAAWFGNSVLSLAVALTQQECLIVLGVAALAWVLARTGEETDDYL